MFLGEAVNRRSEFQKADVSSPDRNKDKGLTLETSAFLNLLWRLIHLL